MENLKPIVDILSEQLNERIVMTGTDYVYLANPSNIVPDSEVEIAEQTQIDLQKESLKDANKKEAQDNMVKTDTAMTVDMFDKMSLDEQTAMTAHRAELLATAKTGEVEPDDGNPRDDLISALSVFGIEIGGINV